MITMSNFILSPVIFDHWRTNEQALTGNQIFTEIDSYYFNSTEGAISFQGVIHLNFGKKKWSLPTKSQHRGFKWQYQDACNFENSILHQFKKLVGIKLDVWWQVVQKCNGSFCFLFGWVFCNIRNLINSSHLRTH